MVVAAVERHELVVHEADRAETELGVLEQAARDLAADGVGADDQRGELADRPPAARRTETTAIAAARSSA